MYDPKKAHIKRREWLHKERLENLKQSGVSEESAIARKSMGFKEREATARLECERDGLDPDAHSVDRNGNTTVCGPNGELFPNHEVYDLVLFGYMPRPVKRGRPN